MEFNHTDHKKYGGIPVNKSKIDGEVCLLSEEVGEDRYSELDKKELYSKIKKYQKTGDENLHRIILESHMKLVLSRANRYKNPGASLSELVDEGTIGLDKAVDNFDESKGDFTLYASICISRRMQDFFKNSSLVRLSGFINMELSRARKFIDTYYTYHGEFPTSEEIINRCKVSKIVIDVLDRDYGGVISLDTPIGGESLHELVQVDDPSRAENRLFEEMEQKNSIEEINRIVLNLRKAGTISERDFDTFFRYYNSEGGKETYCGMGREYGITGEAVRLGLEKVKKAVRLELQI